MKLFKEKKKEINGKNCYLMKIVTKLKKKLKGIPKKQTNKKNLHLDDIIVLLRCSFKFIFSQNLQCGKINILLSFLIGQYHMDYAAS